MFKAFKQLFGLDILEKSIMSLHPAIIAAMIAGGSSLAGSALETFGGGGDYEEPRFYPIPEWAYPKLLEQPVHPPELATAELPQYPWAPGLLEQGAGIVGGLGESIYGRGEVPWYLQELTDISRQRGTEALERAYYGTPQQAGLLAQSQAGPASSRLGQGRVAQSAYQTQVGEMGRNITDLERALQTAALQETAQVARQVPEQLRAYGTTLPPTAYKWYEPYQYQWFTPAIGGFPQQQQGGQLASTFSQIGQALPWLLSAGSTVPNQGTALPGGGYATGSTIGGTNIPSSYNPNYGYDYTFGGR
jgi:hypothetical protein